MTRRLPPQGSSVRPSARIQGSDVGLARATSAWPAVLLVVALCAGGVWHRWAEAPAAPRQRADANAGAVHVGSGPSAERTQPPAPAAADVSPLAPRLYRLASFGDEHPGADVRHVAHWAVDSGDHQDRSFVIVDKKDARVWLFDPRGELIASTPALMGAAVGDDPVPGIGEKPLSQVLPEEKTTPAGRYVAEPGQNANGEDVVWVSWDLAVSMHRVRPLVKAERRLERLASPTPVDNRISFGCINLPVHFYEAVLRPVVLATGAIVYVLPETRTPQQQFGSYDVPQALAALSTAHAVK